MQSRCNIAITLRPNFGPFWCESSQTQSNLNLDDSSPIRAIVNGRSRPSDRAERKCAIARSERETLPILRWGWMTAIRSCLCRWPALTSDEDESLAAAGATFVESPPPPRWRGVGGVRHDSRSADHGAKTAEGRASCPVARPFGPRFGPVPSSYR